MCGIGGFVDFNAGVDPTTLRAMTAALGRRGPDAQGTAIVGACGLAHARLSIIDIAGSPQPMTAADSGYSIVYNGEIYNYLDLRRELKDLGETLETRGDTEALLRWLARSGWRALPKIDGMFAFGAWDSRQEQLLLGRDPLGEKPLFYATPAPGILVFGSEAKAVLAHPAVDRRLNEDALRQALRFRAVYGSESLHRGVQQLEPGCYLEFSRRGLNVGRYFDLIDETARAKTQYSGSDESLIARGRDLFMESVGERLVGDVPVGAFLSGGLDSSLIVAAMRHHRGSGEGIRTYSVGFEGDPKSELGFAKMAADKIGSIHEPIAVGPESYIRRFAELSACRDGPVSQPADIAIAEMSHVAKAHVKVVLSGEGADEVFAGYPKYGLAGVPKALRAGVSIIGSQNLANLAGLLRLDKRRALVAARALAEPREVDRIVQWFSYFDRGDLKAMLPGLAWSEADWEKTVASHSAALARLPRASELQRMQMTDCLTWLPGNMLERGDRMTMAEGLEVRPPFLDKELVAFGLSLPARFKTRGNVGKWIVRQWGDALVPPEILKRPKWGFRTPLTDWFRGPLQDFLHDQLHRSGGLCATYGEPAAIARLLEQHRSGARDNSEALWTLLSAEVWYSDVYLPRTAAPQGGLGGSQPLRAVAAPSV
jgi:asparagine synthase (glutamine-hydrolysing)